MALPYIIISTLDIYTPQYQKKGSIKLCDVSHSSNHLFFLFTSPMNHRHYCVLIILLYGRSWDHIDDHYNA